MTVTPDSSNRLANTHMSQSSSRRAVQEQAMPVSDMSTSGSSNIINPYNNFGTAKLVWSNTLTLVRVRLKLKMWTDETVSLKLEGVCQEF